MKALGRRAAKREVITKETCLECGACCVSLTEADAYCDVTPEDEKKLGKKFVRLNVLHPRPFDMAYSMIHGVKMSAHGAIKTSWKVAKSGPFKGISACQCVALTGALFDKVRCSVYEKRPRVCREAVVPGDRACREIRTLMKKAIIDAIEASASADHSRVQSRGNS